MRSICEDLNFKWELILFCARENHSALKIKIHYTVIHGSDLLKRISRAREDVGALVVFNLVRRKKIVKGRRCVNQKSTGDF